MDEATRIGSLAKCGDEACAPLPWILASKSPVPASSGPGLEAMAPVGTDGITCMLKMASISSRQPSCNIW